MNKMILAATMFAILCPIPSLASQYKFDNEMEADIAITVFEQVYYEVRTEHVELLFGECQDNAEFRLQTCTSLRRYSSTGRGECVTIHRKDLSVCKSDYELSKNSLQIASNNRVRPEEYEEISPAMRELEVEYLELLESAEYRLQSSEYLSPGYNEGLALLNKARVYEFFLKRIYAAELMWCKLRIIKGSFQNQ
jgi:hypothetical protein